MFTRKVITFEELLEASGEEQLLKIYQTAPVKTFAVSKLFNLFHRYTLVGGMPEIVQQYLKHKDIPSLKTF